MANALQRGVLVLAGLSVLSCGSGGGSGGGGGAATHAVGGTVSGLQGAGLALMLGSETLPVAQDGAFHFAAALARGAAYSVRVASQPSHPSQACAVQGGDGTMGDADVANVTVVCTTSTFTIGGTVAGLQGAGLVLRLNGGGDLPVAADGSFTFAAPQPDGATYSVAIQARPAGQGCGPLRGAGKIDGANVTSVRVRCGPLGAEGAWAPIGPTVNPAASGLLARTGRVSAVALASATTWFAATGGGGVWKTTDAGGNWTPLTDGQPTLNLSSIALDPANPNRLWAGTGEAHCSIDSVHGSGILVSVDGGATWTSRGQALFGNSRIGKVALDPSSPPAARRLYAAANRCLPGSVPPERGLAGESTGLAQSTDGGLTWTFLPGWPTGSPAFDVVVDPAGVVYATRYALPPESTALSGLYRSTDAGATFTRLTTGLPSDWTTLGSTTLALSASDARVLVALVSVGVGADRGKLAGLFRTTDGGATWSQTSLTSMGRQWFYNNAVAIDPVDPAVLYVGGIGLQKNTTAGTGAWADLPIALDNHGIAILPSNPQIVVVANDNGVWQSSDGGAHFAQAHGLGAGSLVVAQGYGGCVHPADDGRFILGLQDLGVLRLDAAGWKQSLAGDAGQCVFEAASSNSAFFAFGGYVSRSDDGGATWPLAKQVNPAEASGPIMPIALENGVLYSGGQTLARSTDRGQPWTAFAGQTPRGGLTAIATHGARLYIGEEFGSISSSSNGGASWQTAGSASGLPAGNNGGAGRTPTGLAVDPSDDAVAYATYSGYDALTPRGHVFRTLDGGATWENIGAVLGDVPALSVALDPKHPNILYVANFAGVFRSADLGATWSPLAAGLPHAVVDELFLNAAGTSLFAVTHGRGVYKAARTAP